MPSCVREPLPRRVYPVSRHASDGDRDEWWPIVRNALEAIQPEALYRRPVLADHCTRSVPSHARAGPDTRQEPRARSASDSARAWPSPGAPRWWSSAFLRCEDGRSSIRLFRDAATPRCRCARASGSVAVNERGIVQNTLSIVRFDRITNRVKCLIFGDHLPHLVLDHRLARLGQRHNRRQIAQILQSIVVKAVDSVLQATAARLEAAQLFAQLVTVALALGQFVPRRLQVAFGLTTSGLHVLGVRLQRLDLLLQSLLLRAGGGARRHQFRLAVVQCVARRRQFGAHALQLGHDFGRFGDDELGRQIRRVTHIDAQAQAQSTNHIM